MTIEHFTKQQFEQALPVDKETGNALWQEFGLWKGEYTYTIQVKQGIVIFIRSSVHSDGVNADVGKDSIRCYLMNIANNKPLGKKSYTTRVAGWQDRMTGKIRELYKQGLELPLCPKCNSPMVARNSKNGTFWGCSSFPKCKGTRSVKDMIVTVEEIKQATKQEVEKKQVSFDDFLSKKQVDITPDSESDTPDTEQTTYKAQYQAVPSKDTGKANKAQLQAIEAPIEGATRVLAPPGSGKTFLMIRRYAYLVNSSINPESILVVCYNRSMADEMLARIISFLPNLSDRAKKQISSIHAACYRILWQEGDRRKLATDNQIKSALQGISEDLWDNPDERPGWKELQAWIDSAKMHGLTSNEDYEYFSKVTDKYGNLVGSKLHKARLMFDARMKAFSYKPNDRKESLLTFADMLLDVETRLKRDSAFRNKWQARFQHVIVDESQDTSGQALRILITLSFEPGQNPVWITKSNQYS